MPEPLTQFAIAIPTETAVRQRLAVLTAEADLLRGLMRLAQRRDRELQRLTHAITPSLHKGATHVG